MAGPKSFTKLRARALDLEVAWQDRIADARALLASSRPAAAIASALYALEIRLKVVICKRLDLEQLPEAFEFHDLEALLVLSGQLNAISDPAVKPVRDSWDSVKLVADRLNDLRYLPDANWTQADAVQLLKWLEDPNSGVLPWLSSRP